MKNVPKKNIKQLTPTAANTMAINNLNSYISTIKKRNMLHIITLKLPFILFR